MERTLFSIWSQGNFFCSPRGRIPIWRLLPQQSFLPRELASKIRSCRVPVRLPGLPGYASQPQESSSRDQDPSSSESLGEQDDRPNQELTIDVELQAQTKAESIIDNIMAQIQAEVESGMLELTEARSSEEHTRTDRYAQALPDEILLEETLQELNELWSEKE